MDQDSTQLLAAHPVSEPPPFSVLNPNGKADVVLLCDHASRYVPVRYRNLGLDEATLHLHIAWDIGARAVAERLAALLDAPLVAGGASRLVIDINRPLDDPTSIAKESDRVRIPGNANVTPEEARLRADEFFWPYHRAIEIQAALIEARSIVPAIIPIHSFTPVMNGFERPWQIGILWDQDQSLSSPLLSHLRANPALTVGDNEPYTGKNPASFSIAQHSDRTGRPNVSIEIRQDLIDAPAGAETWAQLVGDALAHVLKNAPWRTASCPPG
ncbi:MAG: hypothetical protein EXQ91_05020 [Alphaproteobacteria bacterium]|nr:hypothetical protein [Alphaproteobacteria bacterium]